MVQSLADPLHCSHGTTPGTDPLQNLLGDHKKTLILVKKKGFKVYKTKVGLKKVKVSLV
jgi:hypothetical protein